MADRLQAHVVEIGRRRLDLVDLVLAEQPIGALVPIGRSVHTGVPGQAARLDLVAPIRPDGQGDALRQVYPPPTKPPNPALWPNPPRVIPPERVNTDSP